MRTKWFKNIKWELIGFFTTGGLLTVIIIFLAIRQGYIVLSVPYVWYYYIAGIILICMAAGYVAGQRVQRRIDYVHLKMAQVGKGNFSVRMDPTEDESFNRVHEQFNTMMSTVERKMRILQQLGEKEVMERAIETERAVLEERRRMARDLHDSVSQQLFAIHMSASSLPKMLEKNEQQAKLVMDQVIQMSQLAQKQMRALITQLRPLELEGRSLAEALEFWFPDYCRHNGLKGIQDIELTGQLTEAKERQLFLIVQEALANIIKHADATIVSLSLQEDRHHVALHISDDGKGFNSSMHKQGSYGLTIMSERAEKLGGQAEVISRPGAGTTIRIHIPKFDIHEEEENHNGENKNSISG
ncbi:sensor histidine kinase [Paenibacillus sp. PK4536]|jgi:NarL family two-component system sensor histidine kinase LiaS|uniref:Oxygen sensor histidine kinase NreB n=1 Tax=Paenibacillus nuruki TaxID=1886670 RepID=A0A1E3L5B1_9BACL|nr:MULTISPECIES: sensor histidine kinase [Paenibacillus]ODP28948.1 Histidine kinase [Paenibacillus nuruki]TKJ92155.1 sensor histidine kinase [Paenibacillus sp. CFBP13512]WIM37427.1 sensor histidine kinase [Paenibacillus sp. PK4536]CAJ1316035.1 Oxygen sensor histidine kinase NreB [Paenibacillus nuruki]